MYLTFAEYQEMGGTVGEQTQFNSLLWNVESVINDYTHSRVKAEFDGTQDYTDDLKRLCFNLIQLENLYASYLNGNKETQSESVDGWSANYVQKTASDKENEYAGMITRTLGDYDNTLGVPLCYAGVD